MKFDRAMFIGVAITIVTMVGMGKVVSASGLTVRGDGAGTVVQISRPVHWTRACPRGKVCLAMGK